jgi:hypothetical protein
MLRRWGAGVLGLLFWVTCSDAVTSKQYVIPETAITLGDSAQTPSAVITLTALAAGAGRLSAQVDRGAGAHAGVYKWRCTVSLNGTNVVGDTVELYLATSDGTNVDGEVGTADAALATAKRNNLLLMGLLIVDQVTTNTVMTASGSVFVPDRYFSLGLWNATSLPFQTSTSAHKCSLTPMPFEQQ